MKTGKKKMGRPKIEIKKKQFEELCKLQCTEEEICTILGVTDKTLCRWCKETYDGKTFSEVFKQKRRGGLISLRRAQFRQAEDNPTMAIWLGKQYLGQSDRTHIEVNSQQAVQIIDDIPNMPEGGMND